ncbi:MAG TPA: hypothetical protein VGJ57_09115 [Nitrospirales bacterium]|jgi:hypothetical protein
MMSYRDLFGSWMEPDASTPGSRSILDFNKPRGRVEDQEIVESDQRLSESLLWRLTEEFYQQSGIGAWKEVPFYATSNPFIARTYVELLLAFLLDYEPWLKRDEPVYFLELGAGTGAFAFYLLKELQAKKNSFSELQGLDLRYVMTDFAEKNLAFWESHEKFRPFMETGLLDFAVYRSGAEDDIVLRRSGRSLRPGELKNPLLVIANYFFIALAYDIFRLENGDLQQLRLTFSRDRNHSGDPLTLDTLECAKSYAAVQGEAFPDARWNAVLDSYKRDFQNATIPFPVGAFQCVQSLQTLSGDKLVLLISDEGFTAVDDKVHQELFVQDLPLWRSFRVNFHAIAQYFKDQGGQSFSTTDKALWLHTSMNILIQPDRALERTRYVFHQRVIEENPINYLFYCEDLLRDGSRMTLSAYLAFLRMTNYDPVAVVCFGDNLYQALKGITAREEEVLIEALDRTIEHIYVLPPNYNAYLFLGRIYHRLGLYKDCLHMFEESEKSFGPDEQSLYFIPLCHESQGDCETALRYYRRILETDPDSVHARNGILRMEAALYDRH